jgi:hypothetical protein
MTLTNGTYNNAKKWIEENLSNLTPSTAFKAAPTHAKTYVSTMVGRLGQLENLYIAQQGDMEKAKQMYQPMYWEGELAKIKERYLPQFQEILNSIESNIKRVAADLLAYVGTLETQPITSEINAQLDALSKIELAQSDIDLYAKEFEAIPLALRRLEQLAKENELTLKAGDYEEKFIHVYYISKKFFEAYEYAKEFYGGGNSMDNATLEFTIKISKNMIEGDVLRLVGELEELTQK